ncbi:MAG TPA: hypothetical protein VK550_36385 [Polyangiaceae bacterium]|nr:hypothetical protein [Polyangiaceae bacterium]
MTAPELVAGYVVAGKYAVRSLLRHGGAMASYRAVGPKNRDVVVKLYDPAILSFPDLAKALAHHKTVGAKFPEQIIPITESGTDPNSGAPFTITDFQSAPSLAQMIDRGPLSAPQTVALVRSLARATDLLHSNAIAGLTLHPANIFVGPGPQYETRIADLGASLVRRMLPASEKAGRWMPWLAPEQIKAQVAPTETADVFALALVAFFAVTGKPYWRSSQIKAPDMAALRREILGERMPASLRAGEFSVMLNSAVDAVFARALAFRPTDRYATAREFAAGIDAAVSGPNAAEAASATFDASRPAPIDDRLASPADAALVAGRMAPPPPRKMAQRATMLGMGNPPAREPTGPTTSAGAPRAPLATMHGMGQPVVEAPPAERPKTSAPAMMPPMAKASAQATAFRTAVLATPAIAVAPAIPPAPVVASSTAERSIVTPPQTSAQRAGPPALPMAPPPDQMAAVLAQYEASAPDRLPVTAVAPSPIAADVTQSSLASAFEHGEISVESVQTGVAVLGAEVADRPKNSRVRWIASACAVLVLTGGAVWALSGSNPSGSHGRAASDAKATVPAPTTMPRASLEPIAPAPPPPAVREPEPAEPAALAPPPSTATEPALPDSDSNVGAQPPVAPPTAPSSTSASPASAAPHAQPSKKPCGKFLKRCK